MQKYSYKIYQKIRRGIRIQFQDTQLDWLIKGGRVVRSNRVSKADIGIKEQKIALVKPEIHRSAHHLINAKGKILFPGIIDVHTHPLYLDDMESVSRSAAFGGITTLFFHIYAKQGMSLLNVLMESKKEGEKKCLLDFGLHGGLIDPLPQMEEIPRAVTKGIGSFKLFMNYGNIDWIVDDYSLINALDVIAQSKALALVHAENGLAIHYLEDKYKSSSLDPVEAFTFTRPSALEAEAVKRVISLANVVNCPLYIVHLSAIEDINIVRNAQKKGQQVYAETCPQYLTLTESEFFQQGIKAKMSPPLRNRKDKLALWKALGDEIIHTIASDHVAQDKNQEDDFFEAVFGAPQVETMLNVIYQKGINEGKITLPLMAKVMSENPARIFGLYPKKGTLSVDSDADLVILDPNLEHIITSESQHTNADYCLYEGLRCLGKPILSMQRGNIVLKEGDLKVSTESGKFLPTFKN